MKKSVQFCILFLFLGVSAFGQKQPPLKVKKEDFKDLKPSTSMVFGDGNMDDAVNKLLKGDSASIKINLNGNSSQSSNSNEVTINEVEDRYPNGQIKSSGKHTARNTEDGQWYYFREDGSLDKMMFYVDGTVEGPYAEYYPNGQASLICSFSKGYQSGISKSYYENGSLKEEVTHKNGVKEGKMTQYYPNGKASLIAQFVNDEPTGSYVDYYENGNKKKEGTLDKGSMIGTWKHYYENGKLQREETRNASGSLEGVNKAYFENGNMKYLSNFKNGKENCTLYKEWYENGKLKMEGEVKDGESVGLWKFYDESGKVSEQQY
jgi:antitoxin component YwqK of YwqJK toxin-antitoxin module